MHGTHVKATMQKHKFKPVSCTKHKTQKLNNSNTQSLVIVDFIALNSDSCFKAYSQFPLCLFVINESMDAITPP